MTMNPEWDGNPLGDDSTTGIIVASVPQMLDAEPDPVFEDVFQAIFDEALNLLFDRQVKYGPDNIEEQGIYGVFTRIRNDKMNRIARVLQGQIVDGELVLDEIPEGEDGDTFEDACFDTANYALIMLALYRGLWGAPLEAEYDTID